MEEDIKILEEIRNGAQYCLEADLQINPNNAEDIEHWKKEIKAIENIVNSYNREKARADKLEKEYSTMLTKIDEYEVKNKELEENSIPKSVIREKIEELKECIEEAEKNIKNTTDEEKEYWKKQKHDLVMQRNILQEILEG